jgi:hypothetical protein
MLVSSRQIPQRFEKNFNIMDVWFHVSPKLVKNGGKVD